MDKKIGTLVKTSFVDFPGMISAAVFLKNCNLRCPYCYNGSLVDGTAGRAELKTLDEIKDHLKKRRGLLDGVVISGGEALLSPCAPELISFAKKLDYKIKLDTNGTLPDILGRIVSCTDTRPDFISMDIKTSPEKYHQLLNAQNINDRCDYESALKRSIKIISSYPSEKREFRTVLVPTLVKKDDIKSMGSMLPKDASWQFARFQNGGCLDRLYNALEPYSEQETEELVSFARTIINGARLR